MKIVTLQPARRYRCRLLSGRLHFAHEFLLITQVLIVGNDRAREAPESTSSVGAPTAVEEENQTNKTLVLHIGDTFGRRWMSFGRRRGVSFQLNWRIGELSLCCWCLVPCSSSVCDGLFIIFF